MVNKCPNSVEYQHAKISLSSVPNLSNWNALDFGVLYETSASSSGGELIPAPPPDLVEILEQQIRSRRAMMEIRENGKIYCLLLIYIFN
jgi:hypothetical protein